MRLDRFGGKKIVVIGDVMLDHFVYGAVERVSPEAPALVLNVRDETFMAGGAANVAVNVAALSGQAILIGVVGRDDGAARLRRLLQAFGGGIIDVLVEADGAPTIQKTRYISHDRHLLRADRESVGLSAAAEAAVIAALQAHVPQADAVIVSDYAKGVASDIVLAAVFTSAKAAGIPVVVDPKRRDLAAYAGASVITPNRKELAVAALEPDLDAAAVAMAHLTGAAILLKRSEDGMALYDASGPLGAFAATAGRVREVSGAGDTVAAAFTLALAAGAPLLEAAEIANVAAGVSVGKPGTASVSADELQLALLTARDTTGEALSGKLATLASAVAQRRLWAEAGLTVGFTNGCFDLIHPGHIRLLEQSRAACDRLIVALNTDASVSRLKGPTRPVQHELARAEVIGALRAVDLVLLFDEDTPINAITALLPDVLIKGADYREDQVVGAEVVKAAGGRVRLIDLVPDQSTSSLIRKSTAKV